jgi:hypothetical protein
MKNSKLLLLLSCLFAAILTAPILTAAPRGGGGFSGGRAGFSGGGAGFNGSRAGFNGGRAGFNGGRAGFNGSRAGFNGGHFAGRGGMGHNHGHPNHVHNRVVFIGGFGFPWWWGWGWGWGPWWGWDGYPYGYGYGYEGSNYGANGYGQYGDASKSRVAELQRRLQRAGYYHGSIDGVLGAQTRAAIRAYEQDHGDVS